MPHISPALLWAIAGIVLVILEMVSVTFVLVFFGIGALITAVAVALGVESFAIQAIVFSVSSLLLLVLLRKGAKSLFSGTKDLPPDHLGARVLVTKEIPAKGEGKVEYRGTVWIAFTDTGEAVPAGSMVEIVGADGIRFKVKKGE